MSIFHQRNFITLISLILTLVVAGCSGTKSSQCKRLINIINKGVYIIDSNKGKQVKTSLQMSKDLVEVTKSLKEANITDSKLQEFQGNFVKVFQDLSQAITKASQALDLAKNAEASSSGRTKIEKARSQIDNALTTAAKTAGKKSDELGNQLNDYCEVESHP
jgi:hypothetical protein